MIHCPACPCSQPLFNCRCAGECYCRHPLCALEGKIDHLIKEVHRMTIDQATFDTDLAALVTAIGTLTQAVDAALAARPPADLTAEDQSVQAAAQAVSDELAKISPAAPGTAPGQ